MRKTLTTKKASVKTTSKKASVKTPIKKGRGRAAYKERSAEEKLEDEVMSFGPTWDVDKQTGKTFVRIWRKDEKAFTQALQRWRPSVEHDIRFWEDRFDFFFEFTNLVSTYNLERVPWESLAANEPEWSRLDQAIKILLDGFKNIQPNPAMQALLEFFSGMKSRYREQPKKCAVSERLASFIAERLAEDLKYREQYLHPKNTQAKQEATAILRSRGLLQ